MMENCGGDEKNVKKCEITVYNIIKISIFSALSHNIHIYL